MTSCFGLLLYDATYLDIFYLVMLLSHAIFILGYCLSQDRNFVIPTRTSLLSYPSLPRISAMDSIADKVTAYVSKYMAQYDASHDYHHIQRVLRIAKTIEARELTLNPTTRYRSEIVTLASLLHDVGDKKYLKPSQDGTIMVEEVLVSCGADAALAKEVQIIVNHVSYSSEVKDAASVQSCLSRYPELGVVQDADRLDAIGAVGIGRCFAYTAAVGGGTLEVAIAHFQEKLEKLESMMKTQSGKEMAVVRTQRIKEFRGWWIEEMTC